MEKIDLKYDLWKNKLLDLGKRNRLLNYRETQLSAVRITYPDCAALYDLLVKEEKAIIFPMEEENAESENANVKSDKSPADLYKALRNLRSKARTAIEEQGVNVLYLSFGFLKWNETAFPDNPIVSPLILVPVTIGLESIVSPFTLTLHQDEIILNPTLSYKLENDFGLTLPEFDSEGDIKAFFDGVRAETAAKHWTVEENVSLSLLSFLKINMYEDLDRHKETILSNPIVKAISGDPSGLNKTPLFDVSEYDFDKNEKPEDVFQVVDADASQQEAILMAKKGVSFVLQGPPGTGKSQTITNIIAESLAAGKKVLFVSEKAAALDVVYQRLASAGLEDFCLVLHSHKANKKSVLEQLGRVLELSRKKVTLTDEAYRKLDALHEDKARLNAYAEGLHKKIPPLNKSIYEANGIIAGLENCRDLAFSLDGIAGTDRERYNGYCTRISRLSSAMGRMTEGRSGNPWRGCKLTSLSNELRQNITGTLRSLLPKIKELENGLSEIFSVFELTLPHTVKNAGALSLALDCALGFRPLHLKNPTSDSEYPSSNFLAEEMPEEITALYNSMKKCNELGKRLSSLSASLSSEYEKIAANETEVKLSDTAFLTCTENLSKEREELASFISRHRPYSEWNRGGVSDLRALLSDTITKLDKVNGLTAELLKNYEDEVLNVDYKALLNRLKTEYTSFAKIFKKDYRQDKKLMLSLHRQVGKKTDEAEMLYLAEKLRELDGAKESLNENLDKLKPYFGGKKEWPRPELEHAENKVKAFEGLQSALKVIEDMSAVCSALDELPFGGEKFLLLGETGMKAITELKQNMTEDYGKVLSLFGEEEARTLENTELGSLCGRLETCETGMALLEEWIDYSLARDDCIKAGLGSFIEEAEKADIIAEELPGVFKKRFFRLWNDAVLPNYPEVQNFRRRVYEDTKEEFSSLDKLQFEIAKARIKASLINGLPSLEHFTDGVDEISILKKELSKQRRIMPIRRLFKAIPNLLPKLKPCLMMSPLSVSLFLEAETYRFDTVIFDEASQVCTENAIGAISRAGQAIIAGDSRQLPPTNFFQAAVADGGEFSDGDFDETDDLGAYESVLDEANMLPERTLRWHYRSRHESLIAFSNIKLYGGRMITFPSNIETGKDVGVEYVYVQNGFYDRGGRKGNTAEAAKAAELVFKHFKEHPKRSLGVIAFGEVQQQAIETAIRAKRLDNREFEPFFAEDKEDAFFVKNLENVQGDERDTIIFSIGYAKDAAGVFRMNFGPLSKSGGERRLNVAITRAKYNIKLIGSIMPDDINTDKIHTEGPKLLRAYIDFAVNGPKALLSEAKERESSDENEHDSPFEKAVYDFLENRGYKLSPQVGCSGYRIDMAVKHPNIGGVYVLGIECDGASYHSARTARERDRLRQDVLERMGWTIYRVWSTDWIKDPAFEGQKLIEAIEAAILSYNQKAREAEEAILGEEKEACAQEEKAEEENGEPEEAEDFVNIEEKILTPEMTENPYGFEEAKITDFESMLKNNIYGVFDLSYGIIETVNNEYPIHYDLLCQRIAPLLGNEKVTVKVKREADEALLRLNDKIERRGDFLYPAEAENIPVRIPNTRKIHHISNEELAEAMYRILKTCVGTTKEALSGETMRVYGFSRCTESISAALDRALELLVSSGRAMVIDGKLTAL